MSALTIGVAEAKNNFSKVTNEVRESGKPVTVLKNNKPWVIISPANNITGEIAPSEIARDFMEEYNDVFEELAK